MLSEELFPVRDTRQKDSVESLFRRFQVLRQSTQFHLKSRVHVLFYYLGMVLIVEVHALPCVRPHAQTYIQSFEVFFFFFFGDDFECLMSVSSRII